MFSFLNDDKALTQIIIVYALVAFSLQVALRAGTFSLASIGFYGVGSYIAADLVKTQHQSGVVAIAAAIVAAGIAGWVLSWMLIRLKDLYLGMATTAFDLMIGVVALNWSAVTGGAAGLYSIPVAVSLDGMIWILLGVIVLLALLERGTISRTFEATRADEQLALVAGIDTRRYRRFAFTLSAMLGSLAGALHALTFYTVAPDDANFSFIILALAMVIIGGFGSWSGALVGAFLIAWLPTRLTFLGSWWPVVYGAAMIIVASYIPGGFFAVARAGFLRLRATTKRAAPVESAEPLKVGAAL